MDGRPVDVEQLKQDMLICRGEAQKARLSAAGATGGYAVSDVYAGCLAGRGGYVMTPN